MCEVDGQWNRGEVRDSRVLWCDRSRRWALNKWRFNKRRAGFAIGCGDQYRSRNRHVDDDSAVFLLIRATGDWLSNMLRHIRLSQIQTSGKTLLALTWLSWLSCLKWYFRQLKDNLRQLRHLSQVKARSVFPDGRDELGHCLPSLVMEWAVVVVILGKSILVILLAKGPMEASMFLVVGRKSERVFGVLRMFRNDFGICD